MTDADSCPIIWTEYTKAMLWEKTDGMTRPEELGEFDENSWEAWARYSWENGLLKRGQCPFIGQHVFCYGLRY